MRKTKNYLQSITRYSNEVTWQRLWNTFAHTKELCLLFVIPLTLNHTLFQSNLLTFVEVRRKDAVFVQFVPHDMHVSKKYGLANCDLSPVLICENVPSKEQINDRKPSHGETSWLSTSLDYYLQRG